MSTPTPPWGGRPEGEGPGTPGQEPTQPYPSYGQQQPPQPPPEQPPYGQPPYGQPPYGQPVYGQPQQPGFPPPPAGGYDPYGQPPQGQQPAGYYGYGYGYGAPAATNGMAIASLVVSILSAVGICLCLFPGLIGAVGAILGHVARKQIATRGEQGAGLALSGIIVGWIAFGLSLVLTAFYVVVFVASGSGSWDYSTF